MKISVNQIPPEGLFLEEELSARELDLETDTIKFRGPLKIKAEVSRITNAVTVNLELEARVSMICSRCLAEIKTDIVRKTRLGYPVERPQQFIDLDSDIREEIILDYPIAPLCTPECLGLCLRCGKNLNEGKCECKS